MSETSRGNESDGTAVGSGRELATRVLDALAGDGAERPDILVTLDTNVLVIDGYQVLPGTNQPGRGTMGNQELLCGLRLQGESTDRRQPVLISFPATDAPLSSSSLLITPLFDRCQD